MSVSDEKARRANVGLNFEAFYETNNSTVPRAIEPARQRYLACFMRSADARCSNFSPNFRCARLSPIGFRSMRRSIPRSWPRLSARRSCQLHD